MRITGRAARVTAGRSIRVALIVGCAAGTVACGTTVTVNTAVVRSITYPDPLANLTGTQIFGRAFADTKQVSSVRMSGSVTDSGMRYSLDLSFARGHGCEGSVAVKGQGSLQLVDTGKVVWLRADKAFYKSNGLTNPATLSVLSGKYLKITSASAVKSFATFCNLSALLGNVSNGNGVIKGARTTIGGQSLLELRDTTVNPAVAYVTDTARPELVRIVAPGNAIAFSRYNTQIAITPPPASETLDGKQYGF
jgi:hypothetical protein